MSKPPTIRITGSTLDMRDGILNAWHYHRTLRVGQSAFKTFSRGTRKTSWLYRRTKTGLTIRQVVDGLPQ